VKGHGPEANGTPFGSQGEAPDAVRYIERSSRGAGEAFSGPPVRQPDDDATLGTT